MSKVRPWLERAVKFALRRQNHNGEARATVQRALQTVPQANRGNQCELSVVLGSYNRGAILPLTIDSIRTNNIRVPYEIIVVDGGSTDGSLEWLIAQKDITTIVQHNRGEFLGKTIKRRSWGYFMNLGFKAAQGRYILMLSDDCLLLSDAVNRGLERLAKLEAEGRNIGGGALYFRNWPTDKKYCVQKTLGGKLMVNHGFFRKSALEKVGWADEDRYMFYKADGDLCLKLWQAGLEIVDCPGAYVEHYMDPAEETRQTNNAFLDHDRSAYRERWRGTYNEVDMGPDEVTYEDPDHTAQRIFSAVSCNGNSDVI